MTPTIRVEADRLEELRLTATEARIDAELRQGTHGGLIAELNALVEAHPLREQFWRQLMLALYQSDRQAEALAAYRRLYRTLGEELGVEPARPVRELHQRILASDPSLTPDLTGPDRTPVPRQLPPDIADFTGRDSFLLRLDGRLGSAGPIVIAGIGGLGKTTLAVHWTHRTASRFPDGQLYVDLRGYGPDEPVGARDVLVRFLRALGTDPARIPVDVDEAAALYRTLLAGKRLSILLDNAASAEQVRPLLPGTTGCLVVVTSRDRLTGLVARDSAYRIDLDRLSVAESVSLLAGNLGSERVADEPAAAEELAELCDHLPLALRVVAAQLVDRPGELAGFVAELRQADRMAAMQVDGDPRSSVTVAFDHSYQRLAAADQRFFRMLGLMPGQDFSAAALASLADVPLEAARESADRLVARCLLEERGNDRYATHDLLALYALELCRDSEPESRRTDAVARLLRWYLAAADRAVTLVVPQAVRLPVRVNEVGWLPGLEDSAAAQAWLEAEQANLAAVVQRAAHGVGRSTAWLLGDTLRAWYFFRRNPSDWLTVAELGLAAALEAGHPLGQASAELSSAQVHRCVGDYEAAGEHGRRALGLCRSTRWRAGEAYVLNELAVVHLEQGRLREAVEPLEQALAIDREISDVAGQVARLTNLGLVTWQLGQLESAAERLEQTLALLTQAESPHRWSMILANLGEIYRLLGRLDQAQEALERALAVQERLGYESARVATWGNLSNLYTDLGRFQDALDAAESALDGARRIRSPRMEATALCASGAAKLGLGRRESALRDCEQAEQLAREGGNRREHGEILLTLGAVLLEFGRTADAARAAHTAVESAQAIGDSNLERAAQNLLAGCSEGPLTNGDAGCEPPNDS